MKPDEVEKRLKADGWFKLKGGRTGHRNYKHPTKPGKVQVPFHSRDINPWTLKKIEKQSEVLMS